MRTALSCVALVGAEIRFSPLSRERVTWPTALVTCKSKGAELVVVRGYLSAERRNIDGLYLRLSFGGLPKFNR